MWDDFDVDEGAHNGYCLKVKVCKAAYFQSK